MNKKNDSCLTPRDSRTPPADASRRRFLMTSACALGGVGAVCALAPFVASWMPSAKAVADGMPVQVDVSHLEPGQQMTVLWRGKPVWIIRRTPQMLAELTVINTRLRDPDSRTDQQPAYAQNPYRSIIPEYLVLIGLCTHLGCVPNYKPHEQAVGPHGPGGFYCPCHGSTFDLAGRVFKDVPAPINLAVPPYHFLNEHSIVIGESAP